jgi:citrate synthase
MEVNQQSPVLIDYSAYPHVNKGLEGLVVLSSQKSFIDGEKGVLIYEGYDIHELAQHASFEEVAFLLWHNRMPNKAELHDLNAKLIAERAIPEAVFSYIRHVPQGADPMAVLRTATSMLSDYDVEAEDNSPEANYRKSIRLTAKMPALVAAFDRARHGKEIVKPLSYGSTAFNFLYMLNGELPGHAAERVMDVCLVLHAEHGMNASTFVCRSTASTLTDIYSSVTAAVGSLKGPLHGGANTEVMELLMKLSPDTDIAEFVRGKLARKEKIPGFGHRVYKTVDPRATHLRTLAKALSEEVHKEYLYNWSETMVTIMKTEKNIDPNVDFFSATVYYSMGIMPDIFTCIFAMARVTGWTAHFLEQMENNRLVRPRQLYIGPKGLKYVPVDQR